MPVSWCSPPFPGCSTGPSVRLGIYYPPAAFLMAAVAFLFVLTVHFSWELSRLEERTRTLAEEVALLRNELERRSGTGRADPPADEDEDRDNDAPTAAVVDALNPAASARRSRP